MPTKTETLIKLIDDAIINLIWDYLHRKISLYDELNLILKDLEIENGKLKKLCCKYSYAWQAKE